MLGTAFPGPGGLGDRCRAALPHHARAAFDEGRGSGRDPAEVARARRVVVESLFWPLLYWHDPAGYAELVAGERIHPRILEAIDLDGRTVCDVGAGAGRFTLHAARRAAQVVAVDAVPPLLDLLEARCRESGSTNVELRRGSFDELPLEDGSVDLAVACSSVTARAPFGGEVALAEMERVVRPGGELAIIWPDRPDWFRERGFTLLTAAGNDTLSFADPASAERICRAFYSEEAARWVAKHEAAEVPFAVVGIEPPNQVCLRTVDGKAR